MTQYFTFDSEAEAEEFCTEGYPIYGKNLKGVEVRNKGITRRAAEWRKHPTEEVWLVEMSKVLEGREGEIQEFDKEKLFPPPKMEL